MADYRKSFSNRVIDYCDPIEIAQNGNLYERKVSSLEINDHTNDGRISTSDRSYFSRNIRGNSGAGM